MLVHTNNWPTEYVYNARSAFSQPFNYGEIARSVCLVLSFFLSFHLRPNCGQANETYQNCFAKAGHSELIPNDMDGGSVRPTAVGSLINFIGVELDLTLLCVFFYRCRYLVRAGDVYDVVVGPPTTELAYQFRLWNDRREMKLITCR